MAARGYCPMLQQNKIAATVIVFLAALAGSVQALSQAPRIPRHKAAIVLFDGKNLHWFDTFLPSAGLNSDPAHVFTVEDGIVHVSGTEMGYFITKQEYKN